MPEEIKTLLWPDLRRFGASLTVAHNPSTGKNYLKLSILDRAQFESTCGLPQDGKIDLYRLMRDAGFSLSASETKSKSNNVYNQSERRGLPLNEVEAARKTEASKAYFYSTSLLVKKELLWQFIPQLNDADFVQMPLSTVKHYDFSYLNEDQFALLASQQQQFDDATNGIYYTTPRDREVIAEANKNSVCLNDVLRYTDYPKRDTADTSALSEFNSLPMFERLMQAQTLDASGVPLKSIYAASSIIAYANEADAIAANGGDVQGVERVQLRFALPVAFNYPDKKLLVLKDARYIEVPNLLVLQDAESIPKNVQGHWKFLDGAKRLLAHFEIIKAEGLADVATWDDPKVFQQVKDRFVSLMKTMKEMRQAPNGEEFISPFIATREMLIWGGIDEKRLESMFSKEFLLFLDEFKENSFDLYESHLETQNKAALYSVAPSSDTAAAGKRQDAGEKIGGARKDYGKVSLSANEVVTLNQREIVDIVTKDNVWPALNYREMRDRGVAPEIAYLIRELRHALPVDPSRGGRNDAAVFLRTRAAKPVTIAAATAFVETVGAVRDAVADVKTQEDFLKAVFSIRKQFGLAYVTRDEKREGRRYGYSFDAGDVAHDAMGYKFCIKALPDIDVDENGNVDGYGFSRFVGKAKAKTSNGWQWAIKEKPAKDDENAVESDAEKADAKKARPEPVVPHLDKITRTGVDYRHGKDADEAMLMSTFGFRGVEYGNWLPQNERQLVLNHAFDAFMDLASALDLPPKAMSLGGELAVAFGSRGTGGKKAALAHYEPALNVINLTRMSGAGTLAHEWGHAFDYWLAKASDLSEIRPVSEVSKDMRTCKTELVRSMVMAVNEARQRSKTRDEVVQDYLIVGGKSHEANFTLDHWMRVRMCNWINLLDNLLPEENRNDAFKTFAIKSLDECLTDNLEMVDLGAPVKQMKDPEIFISRVTTMLDAQIGRGWREQFSNKYGRKALDYPYSIVSWHGKRVAQLETVMKNFDPARYPTNSVFLADAEYYDGYRSKKYWSTRVETFARQFECWVQDRVQSKPGVVSQYLVFGREEKPDADYSIYTRGEERTRVASRMNILFFGNHLQLVKLLAVDENALEKDSEGLSVG